MYIVSCMKVLAEGMILNQSVICVMENTKLNLDILRRTYNVCDESDEVWGQRKRTLQYTTFPHKDPPPLNGV